MNFRSCIFLLLFFFISDLSNGFALLSHQAIIDETWESSLKPLLLKKFPDATEQQLLDAYCYLYGGALLPDIGYSPMGSLLFTNLIHYVRNGDFVMAVINESENLNEYAFGLGLLCHYQADKYGHSLGTNKAVAILFPDLKKKYGESVSYENGCSEHARVEFGFDVIQTARGNYDIDAKRRFMSFKVSEPVLEKAFLKTYGVKPEELFGSMKVAIGTFRFAVKQLMPELTEDAWRVRNAFILEKDPKAERNKYNSSISRKDYNKEFGKPGLKTILISFIIGIVPKIGPTSGLKYKTPNEQVDEIFDQSFKAIVKHYSTSLKQLESGNLYLENINFDTGEPSIPGTYDLTDDTYYKLLKELRKNKFKDVSPELKNDLTRFYASPVINESYRKKQAKLKVIRSSVTAMNTQTTTHP